jgi:hypothetical protein
MDCNFDTALFQQRALETVALYANLSDIHGEVSKLWSPLPLPEYGFSSLSNDDRQKFMDDIFEKRKELYTALPLKSQAEYLETYRLGKLLLLFADCTFMDGIPELMSNGFFNIDNFAPCILWLYCINNGESEAFPGLHLISWIPAQLIEKISDSVVCCADESLVFLANCGLDLCYLDKLANWIYWFKKPSGS